MSEKTSQLKTIIEADIEVADLRKTIMTLCFAVLDSGTCQLNLETAHELYNYCKVALNSGLEPENKDIIEKILPILEQILQFEF